MNVDEGTITDFEEKPAEPKSNLASMGIYIFTYEVLKSIWRLTNVTQVLQMTSVRI